MNDTTKPGIFQSRGRTISLHLDDDIRDDLDGIASACGLSRSEAARWLLRFGISVTLSDDPKVAALVDRLATNA